MIAASVAGIATPTATFSPKLRPDENGEDDAEPDDCGESGEVFGVTAGFEKSVLLATGAAFISSLFKDIGQKKTYHSQYPHPPPPPLKSQVPLQPSHP